MNILYEQNAMVFKNFIEILRGQRKDSIEKSMAQHSKDRKEKSHLIMLNKTYYNNQISFVIA